MDQKEHDDRPALDRLLQVATEGFGPLLQRDYWAVIRECEPGPEALVSEVARDFTQFPPADLCEFERRPKDGKGAIEESCGVGDEFDIRIRMAGSCRVSVSHRDRASFTLATHRDHPEAGRITFGAYRNARGDVIFHIRSRARSNSPLSYAGFRVVGEAMQTNTWTEFVNRVALRFGKGVLSVIHAETRAMTDREEAEDDACGPTYRANLGEAA